LRDSSQSAPHLGHALTWSKEWNLHFLQYMGCPELAVVYDFA